jgi:hypothetical protein
MKRRFVFALSVLSVFGLFSGPVNAKGPVVKLVVSGPDLPEPIEVTDPDAIDVVVYGATFIERDLGPQTRASASPVNPYEIRFFVDLPQGGGVKMMYVVYFVWDNAERRGLVYFPGPSDAWYRRNVGTVALPTAGQWYYATEVWGRAVRHAIYEHNNPFA